MRYLILYMSHHGTTQRVAKQLSELLGIENSTVVDLSKSKLPDLNLFHTIIIGGSIHGGRIQSRVRKFCEAHKGKLLNKRIALFLCYMDKAHGHEAFHNAFPKDLIEHAVVHGFFGGEFLFSEMNFLERAIVQKLSGIQTDVSELDTHAIRSFSESILMNDKKHTLEDTAA
ncbi:MAG: hypothetical protein JNM57_06800 [Cyclobacteriaceae bacterium]|nr:hypothetical protein [Cyclobacteriaceae bacterium]